MPTNQLTLTDFQYRQLLHIKLEHDFIYKNEKGNKFTPLAWQKMIDTLTKNDLIVINNGPKITKKGIEVLENWLGTSISVFRSK